MSGRLLIIGGGGREHALAWKLSQSPDVRQVLMTSLNHATAQIAALAPTDENELVGFCQSLDVALVVVGPEAPLAAGIADNLRAKGIPVLGPSKAAAEIESSKIFAKQLMRAQNIPTADFAVCESLEDAREWMSKHPPPHIVKADGLAAGKGVLICETQEEAEKGVIEMLNGQFGDASRRLLIERPLYGREMSFIVLADGKNALPLATSQDYKRLEDGDKGLNTGGMGAISPAPGDNSDLQARIMEKVITPALRGMTELEAPFSGFLYAGLMIDDNDEISVLEFNCRLGDPETQAILPRLQDDLYPVLMAAVNGELSKQPPLSWSSQHATAVVLAAAGYPQKPRSGDVIHLPADDDSLIFHAGTETDEDGVARTAGGRVLSVVELGDTPDESRNRAQEAARKVEFEGVQYRRDIGK